MVRILDRLEAQGYVVRERGTVDRRRNVLLLTQAGYDALAQGDRVTERINAEEMARLSGDERHEMHYLLLRALGQPEGVLDASFDRLANGHDPDSFQP